jgi:hypothetical protein
MSEAPKQKCKHCGATIRWVSRMFASNSGWEHVYSNDAQCEIYAVPVSEPESGEQSK